MALSMIAFWMLFEVLLRAPRSMVPARLQAAGLRQEFGLDLDLVRFQRG